MMKKKLLLCTLLGCLALGMFGCDAGQKTETASAKAEAEEEEEEDEERKSRRAKKKEEAEEAEKKTEEGEDGEDNSEEEDDGGKSEKSSDTPVAGDDGIEEYDGFEYLYAEELMTDTKENKETGKKERNKLTVFIPEGDYTNVSGNYAYGDTMGVNFRVELEPYIRYDEDDYLFAENFEYYVENQYDPFFTVDYKDMILGEVQEVEDDALCQTVEYCTYNNWDDSYESTFVTYYMKEFKDGSTLLVTVEIGENDVTGKTPRLIKELEEFYQFEIDWDKDRAEKKREDYIASGGDHMFSTGYLLFELPENWDEMESTDYDEHVYAPEGDVAFSRCLISIYQIFLNADEEVSVDYLLEDEESAREFLTSNYSENISDLVVEGYDTCLGEAVKMKFSVTEEGEGAEVEMYIIPTDYYVYTIQALAFEDATEDPFVVLADILENGQVRE